MGTKIMTFDEFIKILESEESKKLENFFDDLKKKKKILSYNEWSKLPDRKFLFLTYDLKDTTIYSNLYSPINDYLSQKLGFHRTINGRDLTNNSFVSFISPLNPKLMNLIGQTITALFYHHLPNFKIYLNISSETEYYLHP